MTISLKHSYTAIGPGAGDAEVGVSEWNADHTLTMTSGKILGRSTAGTGSAEEITVGSGLTLSGGTLTASGGGGTPAGSTGEIQFNDGGAFGALPEARVFTFGDGSAYIEAGTAYSYGAAYCNAGVSRDYAGNEYSGVYAQYNDPDANGGLAALYTSSDVFGGYLRLVGTDQTANGVYEVRIPPVTGGGYSVTLTLPTSAGSSGQALTTDGSGVLSWTDPAKSSAPASASATGRAGEIRYDSDFVYVCVASNSWKRAALSTW